MFVWVIKILQYEKIDVSIGIDINKSNKSKKCMICPYWYFKDIGYNFERYVCNKCHNLSIMADELENIAILTLKGVNYGCVLWNITRYDTINRLNNAKFDDKGTLDFGANKTAVVLIKEGVFGGTYFRGIYSGDNGK